VPQQSFTLQLTGNGISNMLLNHDDILHKTRDLINRNIHNSRTGKTMEDIDLLLQQLADLFDHLYYINDVTLRMDMQTDEEIDRFSSTCKRYGQIYRL